jgi:hypothetical protein
MNDNSLTQSSLNIQILNSSSLLELTGVNSSNNINTNAASNIINKIALNGNFNLKYNNF